MGRGASSFLFRKRDPDLEKLGLIVSIFGVSRNKNWQYVYQSTLVTQTKTLLSFIQTHSAPCVTLGYYSEPWYIQNRRYMWKPCETWTRYMLNSAITKKVYLDITQPYSGTLHNACICKNLTYSESWWICQLLTLLHPMHSQNSALFREIGKHCLPLAIQKSDILKILEYSEPWHV